MSRDVPASTLGSLLSELRDEGTTLFRQEIALAKAELSEKIAQAGKSAAAVATAGALAYAGLIIGLIGVAHLAHHGLVAAGLSDDTARWLGFLLVGAIVGLVGWAMLTKARKNLTAASLKPTETAASLRETKQWAQNKIRPAHHEPAH